MKGMFGVLLALVLVGLGAWYFFATSAPSAPAGMTQADETKVEAEVRGWMEEHLASYSELDPEALLGAWAGGECSSVSFADRAANREELEAQVRRVLGGWEAVNLELLLGSVVDVISPEMAVFQGTVRQDYTPQGGEPGLYRVHLTFFLEKINGEWKIRRNHVSGGAWQE